MYTVYILQFCFVKVLVAMEVQFKLLLLCYCCYCEMLYIEDMVFSGSGWCSNDNSKVVF